MVVRRANITRIIEKQPACAYTCPLQIVVTFAYTLSFILTHINALVGSSNVCLQMLIVEFVLEQGSIGICSTTFVVLCDKIAEYRGDCLHPVDALLTFATS